MPDYSAMVIKTASPAPTEAATDTWSYIAEYDGIVYLTYCLISSRRENCFCTLKINNIALDKINSIQVNADVATNLGFSLPFFIKKVDVLNITGNGFKDYFKFIVIPYTKK